MTAEPIHPINAAAEQSPVTDNLEQVCAGLEEARNALQAASLDLSDTEGADAAHGIIRCVEARLAMIQTDAESAASALVR